MTAQSIKLSRLSFIVSQQVGPVSALLLRPKNATCLYLFAHGAGAGMSHPFMEAVSRLLAGKGIATFRYQFPYMEHRKGRPDPKPVLFATVRAALQTAMKIDNSLPLFAGGKSMGGRMTSLSAADEPLAGVQGLAFFGFPLHPPGVPSSERAKHLKDVTIPMLFLQGTRDSLADLTLLRPVCKNLGKRAVLHVVDGGDHSFHVLKNSGTNDDAVLTDLSETMHAWVEKVLHG